MRAAAAPAAAACGWACRPSSPTGNRSRAPAVNKRGLAVTSVGCVCFQMDSAVGLTSEVVLYMARKGNIYQTFCNDEIIWNKLEGTQLGVNEQRLPIAVTASFLESFFEKLRCLALAPDH